VLNNPEATKEEVEAAVSALTKAMAGLIANPVNTNVSEVKPGDTTVGVKTGDTTNMMYPLLGLAIASLGVYGSKKRRYR
ncbi:LPXTG cell wall anchor domain-containing protein, partial [Thomasclavelia cocleata]